jgi:hypothetical protein
MKTLPDMTIVGSFPSPSGYQPFRSTGHHRFAQRPSRFAAGEYRKLAYIHIHSGFWSFSLSADE